MSKPIIGIPGWKVGDNSFGAGVNYLEFIGKFGNARILMPWEEYVPVDVLLLPGGPDVNPSAYGEVPSFHTGSPDVYRQFFFDNRLKNYVEAETPILGICLGAQMLNVFFGGSLTQHLKWHPNSTNRWEAAHDVTIAGNKSFPVNSHHHQCVKEEQLAPDLVPTAMYKDEYEGVIIEAFRHESLPIVGIQWHPEEWYDDFSVNAMQRLCEMSQIKSETLKVHQNESNAQN